MKNKYGFCKGLAALVLLMHMHRQQRHTKYYLLETVIHIIMICQTFLRE